MNYENISANVAKKAFFLAGIHCGKITDKNGNAPSIRDRISAGACLSTVIALLNCDGDINENELQNFINDEFGENWNQV